MVSSAAAPTLWEYGLARREPAAVDAATPEGGYLPGEHPMPQAPIGLAAGPSLDRIITHVWEEVTGHQAVSCPWCDGEMRPRYGAAALPVGAGCTACGATLS
jgi:hypothetical protein